MLTRAVEGVALSEVTSVEPWVAAIRTLARIQITSVGRAAELVECGCPTRALGALADELDPLLLETIPLCASLGSALQCRMTWSARSTPGAEACSRTRRCSPLRVCPPH